MMPYLSHRAIDCFSPGSCPCVPQGRERITHEKNCAYKLLASLFPRSAPLLGGLVDLIAAASAAPLAVEAAAATLRDVLIGCTASAAKTTLRDVTITRGALNADEKGRGSGAASSPTGVIAEAINAWKDINGYMKVHLVGVMRAQHCFFL